MYIKTNFYFVLDLESPQWVAGVWASVEEAAGFGACTQEILCWESLRLGDVANLQKQNVES